MQTGCATVSAHLQLPLPATNLQTECLISHAGSRHHRQHLQGTWLGRRCQGMSVLVRAEAQACPFKMERHPWELRTLTCTVIATCFGQPRRVPSQSGSARGLPVAFAVEPTEAPMSEEDLIAEPGAAGLSSAGGKVSIGVDPEACREGAALVPSGEAAALD